MALAGFERKRATAQVGFMTEHVEPAPSERTMSCRMPEPEHINVLIWAALHTGDCRYEHHLLADRRRP